MSREPPYMPPVDQLLALGEPDAGFGRSHRWADYPRMGLAEADIPELVRMATDEALHTADGRTAAVWAPLHAWRALAQLRASAAASPLLQQLNHSESAGDDWGLDEIPVVLGRIGPDAMAPAAAFLAETDNGESARAASARALAEIAQRFPECADTCVDHLTGQLSKLTKDRTLNAFIVTYLLELRAAEAIDVIREVYDGRWVDESIVGSWDDVCTELGLEELMGQIERPSVKKPPLSVVRPDDQSPVGHASDRSKKRADRKRRRRARKQNRGH